MRGGIRWLKLLLLLLLPLMAASQDDVMNDMNTTVIPEVADVATNNAVLDDDPTTIDTGDSEIEKVTEAVNQVEESTVLSKGPEAVTGGIEGGGGGSVDEKTTPEGGGDESKVTTEGGGEGGAEGGESGEKTTTEGAGGDGGNGNENTSEGAVVEGGGEQNATEPGTLPPQQTTTEGVVEQNNNITDGNEIPTTKESEVMTTEIDLQTTTTTAATTTTTTMAGPSCGPHAEVMGDSCACQMGWVKDPSLPSADGCSCPDLCHAKDSMECPEASQCFHLTCNVVSCRCPNKMYYDPLEKKCIDICQYFGDAACGHILGVTCQVEGETDVGYTCTCADGFTLQNDTCVDINECKAANPCSTNEECKNVDGSHLCPCQSGYMRSENGDCINVNECLNPALYTCEHLCTDKSPGYMCECYDGYTFNDTSKTCLLKNDSIACECEDPTKSICYQPSENETQCFPKPGYLLVNGSYIDKPECGQDSNQWCIVNAVCIEGEGKSACVCQEGYVNNTLNYGECISVDCPVGTVLSGSTCVEPCSMLSCTSPMTCVVGSSGQPECICGTLCQGLLEPDINTSLYLVEMVVDSPSSETSGIADKISSVFGAYFGKSNIEVLDIKKVSSRKRRQTESPMTSLLVKLAVTTTHANMTQEVEQVIKKQCESKNSGTCVLQGGVVVRENSINVTSKDPCDGDPCPGELFECITRTDVSGRFRCECKTGYGKIEVAGTPGYCQDINECNVTIGRCTDEEECINTPGSYVCRMKSSKFFGHDALLEIAIVFGVLFILTLIVAVGLGVTLVKRSQRVREMLPMTETSPGFENHAFHK